MIYPLCSLTKTVILQEEGKEDQNNGSDSTKVLDEAIGRLIKILPLEEEDLELMKNSSFFFEGAIKINEYIAENKNLFKTMLVVRNISMGIGGIGGGALGIKLGLSISKSFEKNGKMITGIALGTLGMLVGAIAGKLVSENILLSKIVNTEEYKKYHEKMFQKIIKSYRKLIESEDEFKNFVCPITNGVIVQPVIYKKQIYERLAIVSKLKQEDEKEIGQLKYDFTYFPKLLKKINECAEKICKNNLQMCVKEVMEILQTDRLNVLKLLMEKLNELLEDGKIGLKAKQSAEGRLYKERKITGKLVFYKV